MLNDIHYAFRTLRQNWGFALTAIISIALAISANSIIFSIADALLLRPLPITEPSRVVSLRLLPSTRSGDLIGSVGEMSYADYMDFKTNLTSFEGLVGYSMLPVGFARDQRYQPQLAMGFAVSENFFTVLGVQPPVGRGFVEDDLSQDEAVVVLSHEFWERQFQSDAAVIGQSVRLNGLDFEVIGVAPESFYGMDQYIRPAFFFPASVVPRLLPSTPQWLTDRSERGVLVKGRLKDAVSIQSASEEASAIAASIERLHPQTNLGFSAVVRTEMQTRMEIEPGSATDFAFISALAALLLLIASANIANLMLSRGQARVREIAVRLAVGASRARLIRQLMIESLLIAVAGAAIGLYLASFGIEMFAAIEFSQDTPIRFGVQLDHRVVYFTLILSVLSAVMFGLGPALQSTKADLLSALKAGDRGATRKRFLGRRALVVAQIAGSLVLLGAEFQVYRHFNRSVVADPGFQVANRITMRFDPTLTGYSLTEAQQFYETLVERVRQAPGIKSAALSFSLPLSRDFQMKTMLPEGYRSAEGSESVSTLVDFVDSSYFQTLGVRVLEGRGFLPSDTADSPKVAVVNEQFARLFLGPNAVGKRFQLNDRNGPWLEVVGVTVTGKHVALTESPMPFVYFPVTQNHQPRLTLIAETSGDPAAAVLPIREVARSINQHVPIFRVQTFEELIATSRKPQVFLHTTLIAISIMGALLAIFGLYALMAFQVGRQTREIGIRMALGAERSAILSSVLKDAGITVGCGIGIGFILSVGVLRLMGAALPMVTFEFAIFALLSLALLLTTLLAAAIPVLRATRVNPLKVLRQD